MKRIISLALCLILCVYTLCGCTNINEPFEEKNYTSDTRIDELILDVRDREIEVSLSNDERIHIKYYESSKEYYDISVSAKNVLTMTGADNKAWTDYIGAKPAVGNRKISLQIPTSVLKNLTISTTNGDIILYALTVTESINLSSNNGDIAFSCLDAGNTITLAGKNGDISGTVIGSYDDFAIQSKIKKGTNNLPNSKNGGTKKLNVSGNNGNINIEFESK